MRLIQFTMNAATLRLMKEAIEDSILFCANDTERLSVYQPLHQQMVEILTAIEIENKLERLISDGKYYSEPTDPFKVILN